MQEAKEKTTGNEQRAMSTIRVLTQGIREQFSASKSSDGHFRFVPSQIRLRPSPAKSQLKKVQVLIVVYY